MDDGDDDDLVWSQRVRRMMVMMACRCYCFLAHDTFLLRSQVMFIHPRMVNIDFLFPIDMS